MKRGAQPDSGSDDFLRTLEDGVRDVLKDKEATAGERISAINAGAKVAMIRHRIKDGDEDSFFK